MKLFITLCVAFAIAAQSMAVDVAQCVDEFKAKHTCMEALLDAVKEEHPDIDAAGLKAGVDGCFESNGCTLPDFEALAKEMMRGGPFGEEDFEDDDEEEGGHGRGHGGPGGKRRKDAASKLLGQVGVTVGGKEMDDDAKKACMETMHSTIKEIATTCFTEVTGIDDKSVIFGKSEAEIDNEVKSALDGKGEGHGKHGPMGGEMKMSKEMIEKVMTVMGAYHVAACAYKEGVCDASKQETVAQCVREQFVQFIPEKECKRPIDHILEMSKKHAEYCTEREACHQMVGAECQAEMEKLPGEMCACVVKGIQEARKDESFNSCMEAAMKHHGRHMPPWEKRKIDSAEMEVEDEAIDEMCSSACGGPHFNPCDPKSMMKAHKKMKHMKQKHRKMARR